VVEAIFRAFSDEGFSLGVCHSYSKRCHLRTYVFAGSPQRGKTRTFLRFSLIAAADRRKRPTRWRAVVQAGAQA